MQQVLWGYQSANSNRPRRLTPPTPARCNLSDDELRLRIFANTAVLFPCPPTAVNPYEIVYATKPRSPAEIKSSPEDSPWQYAMIVRREPSGGFTPLMKGQAWSTSASWSMVLQGLLDTSATLIHRTIGQREMPVLGDRSMTEAQEDLPRYSRD